jgi:hypothetical protein
MAPDDSDLRLLLRSPALTLEPPITLPDAVRRKARRHRLRTRAAGAGTAVVLLGLGVLVGPSVKGSIDDLRNARSQPGEIKPDPRFPAATTEVVTLQQINGAEILTWFEGADWCTATTRVRRQKTCLGPANPAHQGFSWIVPSRSASVTVDNEHVVAGVAPPGASRVGVHMKDGREYDAVVVDGARFVMPVWSARVDDSTYPVEYYVAYDISGQEIARQPAP